MSDHNAPGPGAHSSSEILSQPDCWTACLEQLPQIVSAQKVLETFANAREWLFVGCGSSYYIALSAAASWSAITGQRARAVPASDLLLFPELVMSATKDIAAVIISRSGRTSEALRAAEWLREQKIRILGVTCTANEKLESIATRTITLSPADEQSTVMTRSFTSMLLALQYTAACIAQDDAFVSELRKMSKDAGRVLTAVSPMIKNFVTSRTFDDYIALGQGPYYGLACECALKMSEMSVSYAQSFRTLEFRHGPKSVVSPATLIMFLISEAGCKEEVDVLEEIKALGGTTFAVVNRADDRVRAHSDILIELGFGVSEISRLAPYAFAGQLMGLYTGLKKDLDPDNPRNLTRVVTLRDKSEKTHAAL